MARHQDVKAKIVLMGYYNPILQFGVSEFLSLGSQSGVDAVIVVDLPVGESGEFRARCKGFGVSFIDLITPSTSLLRMKEIVQDAEGFLYITSRLGVTGAKDQLEEGLEEFVNRVRCVVKMTGNDVPVAVGFGVKDKDQFLQVAEMAHGVVVGSRIIELIDGFRDHGIFLTDFSGFVSEN